MNKWSEMSTVERDALVAEKVMGWKDDPYHPSIYWQMDEAHFRSKEEFSPLTSISAAFEVVEKMIESGHCVKIDFNAGGSWQVEFQDFGPGGEIHAAQADELPEAICLTALKAVGVEIEP